MHSPDVWVVPEILDEMRTIACPHRGASAQRAGGRIAGQVRQGQPAVPVRRSPAPHVIVCAWQAYSAAFILQLRMVYLPSAHVKIVRLARSVRRAVEVVICQFCSWLNRRSAPSEWHSEYRLADGAITAILCINRQPWGQYSYCRGVAHRRRRERSIETTPQCRAACTRVAGRHSTR